MTLSFIYAILLISKPSFSDVYAPKNYQDRLAIGMGNTVCLINEAGMSCFLAFEVISAKKPHKFFEDPSVRAVSFQSDLCTNGEKGPQCFNTYLSGENNLSLIPLKMPKLENVKQLLSGFGPSRCAIDDKGFQCWRYTRYNGYTDYKMLVPPPLKNPKVISGAFQAYPDNTVKDFCAIDDEGFKCFGTALTPTPRLKNPKQLAVSKDRGCAIIDDGLHCWGLYYSSFMTNYETFHPQLKNPRVVSMSINGEACVIDDDGGHCWKNKDTKYQVPSLKNPTNISVNWGMACAIDDGGLICWKLLEEKAEGSLDMIRFSDVKSDVPLTPDFHLDQIDTYLKFLVKMSPPAKSKYFSELNRFVKSQLISDEVSDSLSLSRYLVSKLISPAIYSSDSKYGTETIIPKYEKSIEVIEKQLAIKDLSKVPRTNINKQIALHSTLAAFNVLKDFQSSNNRTMLTNITRTLGQAIADPSDVNIDKVVSEIDSLSSILTSAKSNPKSAFLVDTVNLAKEWLGVK